MPSKVTCLQSTTRTQRRVRQMWVSLSVVSTLPSLASNLCCRWKASFDVCFRRVDREQILHVQQRPQSGITARNRAIVLSPRSFPCRPDRSSSFTCMITGAQVICSMSCSGSDSLISERLRGDLRGPNRGTWPGADLPIWGEIRGEDRRANRTVLQDFDCSDLLQGPLRPGNSDSATDASASERPAPSRSRPIRSSPRS